MNRAVIDANTLCCVFDLQCRLSHEFSPFRDSLLKTRNTKVVYGGSKYNDELNKAYRYLRILGELRKKGKAELLDKQKVDHIEKTVIQKTNGQNFNDHHIIAIVIVGKCNIICSKDSNAYAFFKEKKLYPKGFKRPKIYNGLGSITVLR